VSKILIAENSEAVSRIYQRNFSAEGLDAFVALDEKEVLDVTQKEKIDILLINEKIGGYDFVREVRNNNPKMKIFVTGVGSVGVGALQKDQKIANDSGADDFINIVHIRVDKAIDIIMGRAKNEY